MKNQILFFLFISVSLFAQKPFEGTLTDKNNTEYKGQITFLGNQNVLVMSKNASKEFKVENIKVITSPKVFYKVIEKEDMYYLAQNIFNGPLSFFKITKGENVTYVFKEKETFEFIQPGEVKAYIKNKILPTKDFSLIQLINSKVNPISENEISDLVKKYNKISYSPSENKQFKNKPELSIGFDLGPQVQFVKYDYLITYTFYNKPILYLQKDLRPQFGLAFQVKPNEKIAVEIGVNHYSYKAKHELVIGNVGYTQNDTLSFSNSAINVPIDFKFNFKANKLNLFVDLGPQIAFNYKLNSQINDFYGDKKELFFNTNSIGFGAHFGFGVTKTINNSQVSLSNRLTLNKLRDGVTNTGTYISNGVFVNYRYIFQKGKRRV